LRLLPHPASSTLRSYVAGLLLRVRLGLNHGQRQHYDTCGGRGHPKQPFPEVTHNVVLLLSSCFGRAFSPRTYGEAQLELIL